MIIDKLHRITKPLINISMLFATVFFSVSPSVVMSHHSFAVEFEKDKIDTIEGVVTEVWFKNPHVRYYIKVVNEKGEEEMWDVRAGSASNLTRSGWGKNAIKVGDEVTVTGNLGRDGKKLMSIDKIVLPDGTAFPRKVGLQITP